MTKAFTFLWSCSCAKKYSFGTSETKRMSNQVLLIYLYKYLYHHRGWISHFNIRGQDYLNDKWALKWSFLPRYPTIVPDFCSLWASLRGIINDDGEYFKRPLPSVNHLLSSNPFGLYSTTSFNRHNVKQGNILECGSFNITRHTYRFTNLLVCLLGANTFRPLE